MNATFNSMMRAMGFTRVDTDKPCERCQHSEPTHDESVLACFYWNKFTLPLETCDRWGGR